MFVIKSVGLLLGLAIMLGTLTILPAPQKSIAQNSTGNATKVGHTAGLIVRGLSTPEPVSTIGRMLSSKQVTTPGISFNVSNDTGKAKGWWNIPSTEGGNNIGGRISNAKIDKNMFEVKGTMNYDYLCGQKNNLDYGISIAGYCNRNDTIIFKSSNEIASHNFTGAVNC